MIHVYFVYFHFSNKKGPCQSKWPKTVWVCLFAWWRNAYPTILVICNHRLFFFYYEKHIYQYNIQSNTLNELFFNYIDVNYLYYEQIIKNIEAKSERKIYSITNERYFACIIVINFYNSTKICKKFPWYWQIIQFWKNYSEIQILVDQTNCEVNSDLRTVAETSSIKIPLNWQFLLAVFYCIRPKFPFYLIAVFWQFNKINNSIKTIIYFRNMFYFHMA